MAQNVLVVGAQGSGRTMATAWKLLQSPECANIYVAPGNAGTEQLPKTYNVPFTCTPHNLQKLAEFAKEKKIDIAFFTDDLSIAHGGVNIFRQAGIRTCGATQEAGEIEWRKSFGAIAAERAGIRGPVRERFTDLQRVLDQVCSRPLPFVIKADGLMEGKGSHPCHLTYDLEVALRSLCTHARAPDGTVPVVVEEFLEGQEVSYHAAVDADGNILMFEDSQDKKHTSHEKNSAMTGGIGAVAPMPPEWPAAGLVDEAAATIVKPMVRHLAARGRQYTGIIYPGAIKTKHGLRVTDWNARAGDPEWQVYMLRMKSDLLGLLNACVDSELDRYRLEWHEGYAALATLCSRSYPNSSTIGQLILGLEEAATMEDVFLFPAGMKKCFDWMETAGGRVLHIGARGKTLAEAAGRVHAAIECIHFPGMWWRKDFYTPEFTI